MTDPVRVVVVDDELDLREMISDYLGKYGFVVRTAAVGHELYAHLTGDPPDLLILDVNMLGEDGFAIARRVRARSARKVDRDPENPEPIRTMGAPATCSYRASHDAARPSHTRGYRLGTGPSGFQQYAYAHRVARSRSPLYLRKSGICDFCWQADRRDSRPHRP